MRVTQSSIFNTYGRNIEEIQERKFYDQIRLTTGKQLISLSDSPGDVVKLKNLNSLVSRNTQWQQNIQDVMNELESSSEQLDKINELVNEIKQRVIEASQIGNKGNVPTIGINIKSILEEILKIANYEYNGQFTFAGTKTTKESIIADFPGSDGMPFSLDTNLPTISNPSGLSISFLGNNKERLINKDSSTTEVVNTKAEDLFGLGGTKFFESIVNIYNTLSYKSDGTKRTDADLISKDEVDTLTGYFGDLSKLADSITMQTGRIGSKLIRLESIKLQVDSENLRLNNYISGIADTDYAKTAVSLAKDDNILQYSLQVGSRLLNNTLFDFIR